MGHIEATKHLAASPDALWAPASDLAHWGDWFTVHEKWLEEPLDEVLAVQGGAISELAGWHDVRTIETDGPWDIDTIAANLS